MEVVTNSSPDVACSGASMDEEDFQIQPMYITVIVVLLYTLIIVLAVGGNVIVCWVVLANRHMRTVTNLFLLNLAFGDVIKALVCNPFTFVANLILQYWPFGAFMCPLVTYVQTMAVFLSSFTLVAMSLDRYVAIIYPLRPRVSKRRALFIIVLLWLLAAAAPLPTAVTARILVPKGNSSGPSANGLCLEDWSDPGDKFIYTVVVMMLQYFVPLLVLALTNARIGYVVWIKETPGEAVAERDQRVAASKRRMVKMIIVVVVIYAVCWLPLHAITLAGDMDPEIYSQPYMNIVWLIAHWLAMSHSCYNPFVYFKMNNKFRAGFQKVFKVCSPQRGKRKNGTIFKRVTFDSELRNVHTSINSNQSVKSCDTTSTKSNACQRL